MSRCKGTGGHGCLCAYHARKRIRNRRTLLAKRDRQLQAARMRSRTCPRRHGGYGVCGAVVQSDVINGRLVVWCPACDRFERGICRDCPLPVAGHLRKARYCAAHQQQANRRTKRVFKLRHARRLAA